MPTPTHTELPEYSRALLDAAPDAMVITDREGRIVLVNARVESLFGYRRDELLGRGVEVLMPERFHASHPEHRLRYFDEPHPRAMGVGGLGLTARRKDGTEFAVEISLSPLETTDGVVAITAIRDISERRVAEEQAARLIKAQESVRLRDEFLAVAAHELKTPLAALKLQVDGIGRLLARQPGGRADPHGRLRRHARLRRPRAARARPPRRRALRRLRPRVHRVGVPGRRAAVLRHVAHGRPRPAALPRRGGRPRAGVRRALRRHPIAARASSTACPSARRRAGSRSSIAASSRSRASGTSGQTATP